MAFDTFERLNMVTNFIEVAVELLGQEDSNENLIGKDCIEIITRRSRTH